jgi:hypothetical protein
MYPEFKSPSQRAGCIGHTVWITGLTAACRTRRSDHTTMPGLGVAGHAVRAAACWKRGAVAHHENLEG